MSIIRVKKEQKYFVAANAPFQDKNLSWEARGAMGYLLSKPDGWQCRNYDLVNQGPAGEHTIKRIMKELRENGYVHRFKISQGRGKIEWVTEVYESPELNPNFTTGDFTTVVNTTVDTIEVEKSADIVSTDSQKVLTIKNTDSNGSAKNPQKLTQNEKDDLNTLAAHIAKATNTTINDEDVKPRLMAATRLGYKIAQACTLIISIIAEADPRSMANLVKVTISLYQNNVTVEDLEKFQIWWYDNTWQGRDKGQPPTPALIASHWGQFEAAQSAPPANVLTLSDVARENYARLLAEQTK